MNNDLWRQWQALLPFGPFGWEGGLSPPPVGSGLPGSAPAERFAAAFREFVASVQRLAPSPDAASGAAAAAAKPTDAFGSFLREHFADSFELPGSPAAGLTAAQGSVPPGPALGLGREQLLRAQRAAEAWNRLVQAQGRLQRMGADLLREAASAFTGPLAQKAVEPLTTEVIDRMYDRWIECAERAYARTAHSDEFCDALSEYVNAGSDWRREFTAGLEEAAKLWDLPTRGEINTLTRRVADLEARLTALETPSTGTRARSAEPPARGKPKRPVKPRTGRPRRTP